MSRALSISNSLFPCFLQDGSCNGLQHYAALGRDLSGAASVNLVPCGLPQDVYSAVAQQVRHTGDTRGPSGPASSSWCAQGDSCSPGERWGGVAGQRQGLSVPEWDLTGDLSSQRWL